jgi:hypothetical protein
VTTPTRSFPHKPLNIFDTVHNAIARGIHDQNFKNGAFHTSIPCTTSITNKTVIMAAFNILLASPLLEQAEKEIVRRCRGQFMHLRNLFSCSRVPSSGEAGELAEKLGDLKGMFLRDVESRQVENGPAVVDKGKLLTRYLENGRNVLCLLT